MDIKEYISSGILELYALDQLSAPDRAEVERNLAQYPELGAELQRIETTLFGYISAFEKTPPAGLEAKIMDRLEDKVSTSKDDHGKKSGGSNAGWFGLIGLVLLGALAGLYFMNQKNQAEQTELNNRLEKQMADCAENETELQLLRRYFEVANDPNYTPIAMNGTDKYPTFSADIFTAADQQSTFISVKNMPALAANEQFQLWGIVDGTPVSLGIFDVNTEFSNAMIPMQFVANPQAFAVTIEPRGGSSTPTLEKMVVLGNV